LSALAWITFALCAVAVALHYYAVGDSRFLLFAIPGLVLLLVIPLTLNWMSRKTYQQASSEYDRKARRHAISAIGPGMSGDAVRISGTVKKVSFKWLMRPHFQIEDETARIRVIMFTTPSEEIRTEDHVEVLGMVMKNVFTKKKPLISAVNIKKIT